MPESFTSYYEVFEKRLAIGATSQVSRKTLMTSGVGAIQARISYQYYPVKIFQFGSLESNEMNELIDRQAQFSDQELVEELDRNLKIQHESSEDIKFNRYEQDEDQDDKNINGDQDYPDDSSTDEYRIRPSTLIRSNRDIKSDENMENINDGSLLKKLSSYFNQSSSSQQNVGEDMAVDRDAHGRNFLKEDDEEGLKSFPILNTLGSWTMAKETNQVLRAIGKLLIAFGQGFELSNLQILAGFTVVERFYADIPRDRTWDLVQYASEIEMPSYMWKYAMASYGWRGLNFIGKGNGIFSDAVRAQSDALSICEHLDIDKEDLLAYEMRTEAAFRPSYFIARDRKINAIVLSIRGTMSSFDTMTDLVCEYEPWRGGIVHKGMKSSANWFFKNIAPKLIAYTSKHSTTSLYIVGHSLGASTSAILTIMLTDYINKFHKDKELTIRCFGYAPACGLSLDLANKYKDKVTSIVFADDFVSKLSYGSMMDVKELILAGAEASKNIGIGQLIWANEYDSEAWKNAFERISECRKRCLESMSNPRLYVAGTVYQFWLDPVPNNESRIVVERTTPEKVSTELIIKRSILLDHLPTNFDIAFCRAFDSLTVKPTDELIIDQQRRRESRAGSSQEKLRESIAQAGIKNTTERTGGEGNVLGQKETY